MTKICSKCKETKPKTSFGINKRNTLLGWGDGLNCWCKPCRVIYNSLNAKNHPDRVKRQQKKVKLKKNHGLTPEEVLFQLEYQGYECVICDSKLEYNKRSTHIDHCHNTGQLRGILCSHCNHALGLFKDSIPYLYNAIDYLETKGTWSRNVKKIAESVAIKGAA